MIGYAEGTSSCYAAATSPCYGQTYDGPILYALTNDQGFPTKTTLVKMVVDPSSSPPIVFERSINLSDIFGLAFESNGFSYARVCGDNDGCWVQVNPVTINTQNLSRLPALFYFDKDLNFVRAIGLIATDDIRIQGPGFYECARLSAAPGGSFNRIYSQFWMRRNPSGAGVAEFYQPIYEISDLTKQIAVTQDTVSGITYDLVDVPHVAVADFPSTAVSSAINNHGLLLGDGAVVHSFSGGKRRSVIPNGAVSAEFAVVPSATVSAWGGTGLRWIRYNQDGLSGLFPVNPRIEITDVMFSPQSGVYGLPAVRNALGIGSQQNYRLLAIGGI